MNLFRLSADILHLMAISALLFKLIRTKNCAGISGKSQILFVLVFISRYLDIYQLISIYNVAMKILYLFITTVTYFLIYFTFESTYNSSDDSFKIEILLVPTALLSFLVNHSSTLIEYLWAFSIYLEAVAIIPQLYVTYKTERVDNIISFYLIALGCYRALYILNWIYRYRTENFYDMIAAISGSVQVLVYCIFFGLFSTKGLCLSNNREEDIPPNNLENKA